jgi:hypothetical protein
LIAFLFGNSEEEKQEASRLIRHYYKGKSAEDLTNSQLEDLCLMITMNRKKRTLTRQIETVEVTGHCFQCGEKLLRDDSAECRKCHDPIDSVGQYYFNGRWEPII